MRFLLVNDQESVIDIDSILYIEPAPENVSGIHSTIRFKGDDGAFNTTETVSQLVDLLRDAIEAPT